jgi:hypothetical protein
MNGLNVFRGATQIKLVPVPAVRNSQPKPEYKEPMQAAWIIRHMVFLPVNLALNQIDMKTITNRTVEVCKRYNAYIQEELHKGL